MGIKSEIKMHKFKYLDSHYNGDLVSAECSLIFKAPP